MTIASSRGWRRVLVVMATFGSLVAGQASLASAQVAPARPALEPAQSLEGNYLAAIIAGASRDTAAAALYFREALRDDPRNMELVERAFVAFLADGAMTEAFAAAERLAVRDQTNGLANLALAVRHIRARNYQTARQVLARGGRGRAADITATLLTAWAYTGSGEGRKGIETVDRLRGDAVYNVFRDYHAALIADVSGNKAEAARRFKSAYDAERTTLRLVDAYGRFEARRGELASAKAIYEAFQTAYPDQPIVKDALERIEKGQTLSPVVATAQQGAAEVLYGLIGGRQDDNVAALIYLRLALHLHPTHVMALVTLGDVLERAKQIDQAIAVYEQIPSDSPLRASADIQIALALESTERRAEAEARLEALTRADPNNIEAVSALANVLRGRKKFAEAAEIYSRAIALYGNRPVDWRLYYFRGTSYERAKNWPKAEADLKQALSLLPAGVAPRERAQVLNYLGYSWVDQNINVDEAFQMLRQAVELSPRDGYIIDSLGWAYYRLGRFEDAVRELERAVELRPADPVINDHLGDAYWRVGRKLEARFQWSHARDLNPEPEDLQKILAKLNNGLPDDDKPAAAGAETKNNGG